MTQVTGGFYCNNLTIATMALLNASCVVPMDTQAPNGSGPQTLAVPIGLLGGFMPLSSAAVTAYAGGGQANATQLGYGVSVITVVATAADSVKLPPSVKGAVVFIRTADASGSDSCTVYGYGTDTIDAVASATGNAQADDKGKLYYCTSGDGTGVAGTWVTLLGA